MMLSTSFLALPTTFSIRAGWMRPSATNLPRAMRATSRRTGSKLEIITASGVSSTTMSTPVAFSIARMFRPPRPMIRPFTSSLGSGTVETETSATASVATRCMVPTTISRARRSASSRISASTLRMTWAISCRASCSTRSSRMSLASCFESADIRSISRTCSDSRRARSLRARSKSRRCASSLRVRVSRSSRRLSRFSRRFCN